MGKIKKFLIIFICISLAFLLWGCTCFKCGGLGELDCEHCDARGIVRCPHCIDGFCRMGECMWCDGAGEIYDSNECTACAYGYIINPITWQKFKCTKCGGLGYITTKKECRSCWGVGYRGYDCSKCSATGYIDCEYCYKGKQACPKCGNSENYPLDATTARETTTYLNYTTGPIATTAANN